MVFSLLNDKDWITLTKDEEILEEHNPSVWASLPAYVFGGVLVGVGIIAAIYVTTPALGVSVLGVLLAAMEEIRRRFTWYVLTTEEVYLKTGIISQYPRSSRYDDVKDTYISQSVLERIFGFADVYLATPGTDGQEFKMANVPNAQEFKNQIANQIDIAHERAYLKSRDEAEDTGGRVE